MLPVLPVLPKLPVLGERSKDGEKERSKMMRLEQARKLGMEVVEEMAPGCDRVVMGGSVRRGVAVVKDVEIVYLARMEECQADMFRVDQVPATERLIARLVDREFWQFDEQVRRNGPKYKRMIKMTRDGQRMVVELFRAEIENWGLVLALRTGPGDFNRLLVDRMRGAMPVEMVMRDGWLWRRGELVKTVTEEGFFEEIGVPCWPPHQRTAVRLARFLFERRMAEGR